MTKPALLWICFGISALCLCSCGGGQNRQYPLPQAPPPPQPPPVAQQSGSVTLSPQYAALSAGQTAKFTANSPAGGSLQWSVNNIAGGNSTVGTVDNSGTFTAPSIQLSTNAVITAALAGSPQTNFATAVVAVMSPGILTPTANPQVVAYSLYLPAPGSISVQFGPSNLMTSSQPTPSPNGGMVHVYVAGMEQNTTYQMHAIASLPHSISFSDANRQFTTGAAPRTSSVKIPNPAGPLPQPGVELFDTVIPQSGSQLFATDLQGHVIWTYQYSGSSSDIVQGAHLMTNGDFLIVISSISFLPIRPTGSNSTTDVVREIDLAGNTVRELSIDQLTQSLQALGYNFNLLGFHHDALPLPNGHTLVLTAMRVPYNNLPGYPGTTLVLGDVLVDLDQNYHPVWVWNSFDHLDINRHPYLFPDWTHGNAVLYSTDDHNILFSMRHQNWIIKIDYQDGEGSGNIIWRLGPGGDFKLLGGTDPTDWFYAQHGPNYLTPNTTGVFQLGVMDNGDDRQFPAGIVCGSAGAPPCLYSTAEIMQVDESALTATVLVNYTPPPTLYSFFGGNVDGLANGDIEADFCSPKGGAIIQEFTQSASTEQLVWQASTFGASQYRAFRMPSLYPGVQW
ncbi:MAG TPA: aryl-sulfate sulfotransferase [Candidatus Sulfotelmatobacter sp.]|nr:aryl-sulfate sulfotransferase [Candidatus Sulfotelmatobacter sp.]